MRRILLQEFSKLSKTKDTFLKKPDLDQKDHVHCFEEIFLFNPGGGMLNSKAYKVCFGCGETEDLSRTPEINEEIDKIIAQKSKICPKCDSSVVLRIEYGEPDPDYATNPDIYFAGCHVEDYEWHCKKCRWEWGKKVEGRYCEDDIDDGVVGSTEK